jgi:MFS family permease
MVNQQSKTLLHSTNLRVIFSITLIAVMGVASITPAFPKIVDSLGITKTQVSYLVSIFTLPGIFLAPVMGVMSDKIGRKKILVPSLILFGIMGSACYFARDFELLLIFRFFQGVGAAAIGSLNVTLIGDLYKGNQRSTAMGYNASVLSVGTAFYPAIGGALATLGWHYPFLLPFIGILVGIAAIFMLKNPEPKNDQNLKEYLGNAWKTIKNLKVLTIFISSIVSFIIIYGAFLTYFPFLMEERFGSTVFTIGLVMSAASIFSALASSQQGKLTKRFAKKNLVIIALLLYCLTLAIVPYVSNIGWLMIPTILFGVANGINMPVLQTLLAELAPMQYRGAFMSVNGMVLRIGQTLGPVYTGLFYGLWGIKGAFFATLVPVLLLIILFYIAFKEKTLNQAV